MSDDLDDLLRRSMKTLDDQVPSGYFDGLPNRTLLRLEDSTMQTTQGDAGQSGSISAAGIPPAEREDDSGLHDIRNLASSARMRLSSRRISTSPPVDDDILASSSAGWKAVALPEPAKMVSLPEISELPSKAEIKAKEKASRKSKPELAVAVESSRSSARSIETVAVTPIAAPTLHLESAPAVVPAAPMIGARFAAKKAPAKNRNALLGVVGLGLAAAAGAAIFVGTRKPDTAAPASVAREDVRAREGAAPAPAAAPQTVTVTPLIATDEKADQTVGGAPPAVAAAKDPEPADATKLGKADRTTSPKGKSAKPSKVDKIDKAPAPVVETKTPDVGKKSAGPTTGKKDGEEPNFDDLLKEANISGKTQEKKPTLEKKSLSGGDFKSGMNAVAGKAQACFAGTQGTATVRLTVAPSGKVAKVNVSGAFAGTPVAACVENAVKNATFPPWEGGPQSFGYSYLLSE